MHLWTPKSMYPWNKRSYLARCRTKILGLVQLGRNSNETLPPGGGFKHMITPWTHENPLPCCFSYFFYMAGWTHHLRLLCFYCLDMLGWLITSSDWTFPNTCPAGVGFGPNFDLDAESPRWEARKGTENGIFFRGFEERIFSEKKDVEMGSREMLVGGSRRHHKLHRSLLDLRFQIPLRDPGADMFF